MFIKGAWFKPVLLLIYGSFLIALSVFKTNEILLPYIYQFEAYLGGDKFMHLKLSAALSFLALLALIPGSQGGLKLVVHCLGICFLLTLGLAFDEFHQMLISTRRFEWLDFIYGAVGIGIGFVAYLFIPLLSFTKNKLFK